MVCGFFVLLFFDVLISKILQVGALKRMALKSMVFRWVEFLF